MKTSLPLLALTAALLQAGPAAAAVQGWLDGVDCTSAMGWTCDPGQPNVPLTVSITDGAGYSASATANSWHDLGVASACGDNGYHGFGWNVPTSLKDGAAHTITFKVGATTLGSGTITCQGNQTGTATLSSNPPGAQIWSSVDGSAFAPFKDANGNTYTTPLTVPGLAPNKTYCVRFVKSGYADYDAGCQNLPNAGTITFGGTMTGTNNSASCVNTTPPPSSMIAGAKATVAVTCANTGTTTWKGKPWDPATNGAGDYLLGSQNPQDNHTWGMGRVDMFNTSGYDTVAPGGAHTFTFEITAPTTPGAYNFQWRMIDEQVEWFGGYSPNVVVNVTAPPATPAPALTAALGAGNDNAQLSWTSSGSGALYYPEISVAGGAYAGLAPSGLTQTGMNYSPLQPGTTYSFRVKASLNGSMSAYSNVAGVFAPAASGPASLQINTTPSGADVIIIALNASGIGTAVAARGPANGAPFTLPAGSYQVVAGKPGSYHQTVNVTLAPGQSATQTLTLAANTAQFSDYFVLAPFMNSTVSGRYTAEVVTWPGSSSVEGVDFCMRGKDASGVWHDVSCPARVTAAPYKATLDATGQPAGPNYIIGVNVVAGGMSSSLAWPISVGASSGGAALAVALTTPGPGASVASPVALAASPSGGSGTFTKVEFFADGNTTTPVATASAAPWQASWTAAAGAHSVSAKVTDSAAATATSAAVSFTVGSGGGTTPPNVQLTAPSNGATVDAGAVAMTACANPSTGANISSVQFFDNGSPIGNGTAGGASGCGFVFNLTANLAAGSHSLTAKVTDSANQTAMTSAPVSVTATSVTRTITIESPAANASVGAAITASGTISPCSPAAATVTLWAVPQGAFYGPNVTVNVDPTCGTHFGKANTLGWTATVTANQNGATMLEADMKDASGGALGSATVVVNVGGVVTAPSINSFTATPATIAKGQPSTLSWFVTGTSPSCSVSPSGITASGQTVSPSATQTYTLTCTNSGGTASKSVVVTVTNDVTPPTLSLKAPASGATVSGLVTISGTAADDVGVASARVLIDGVPYAASFSGGVFSYSWNTSALGVGSSHSLSAQALDAAGNTGNSAGITVTVAAGPDTTPPTVTLTAPANNATVSGTVSITGTAADNVGVTSLSVTVDGTQIASALPATWTATPGSHVIKVQAWDAAYNTGSAQVTVTVPQPTDTTPPVVTMTAPADGATVSGTVSITGTATDNVGVASLKVTVDGAQIATALPASWTATPGSHVIKIQAWDAANNTASAQASVTVPQPADTTPPVVTITAPANGATVTGPVSITGTATDNVGVTSLKVLVDGAQIATALPASWDPSSLAPGPHAIRVEAKDAAGNTGAAQVSVTLSDTKAPTVTITAPVNGATVSGKVTIDGTASDNVSVTTLQVLVDGTQIATALPATWDASALSGTHTIMVKATDAAGNAGSASVSVTVSNKDVTPPVVTIQSPVNGASVAGLVSIQGTASDNVGVSSARVLIDGALVASGLTYSWDTSKATVGAHSITVQALDAAGNVGQAQVSVTVLDPSVLTVAITAPASGAQISGPAGTTIQGVVTTGSAVQDVELSVDGAALTMLPRCGP